MTFQNTRKKLIYSKNEVTYGTEHSSGQAGGIISNLGIKLRSDLVEQMDLATINSNFVGFIGFAFDGRYLYLMQNDKEGTHLGNILRYDTTAAFTTANISSIDLATIDTDYVGIRGGCFDGRYVYMNCYFNGIERGHWWFRYDTTKTFSTTNVEVLDLETFSLSAEGYEGLTFDGRYVYGIPNYSEGHGGYSGYITRYDTTLAFTSAGLSAYNVAIINANWKGFSCGCFDGRYIYMMTWAQIGANVVRYDTTLALNSSGSYEGINLQDIDATVRDFGGACFDGRYIYFLPRANTSGNDIGKVIRYDTTKDFDTDNCEMKDLTTINANWKLYPSSCFDGRYIYFVPIPHGNLVKYDTTKEFSEDASYEGLDLSTINANYVGYIGSYVTNKYLYLCPYGSGIVGSGNFLRIKIKP